MLLLAECLLPRQTAILEKHADGVVHVVLAWHWDHFLAIQSAADLSAVGLDDRERDLALRMIGQHHNTSGDWRRECHDRNSQAHQD